MQVLSVEVFRGAARIARKRVVSSEPQLSAQLGQGALSSLVALAVARADEHGIRSDAGIQIYLQLMRNLGCDFDRDPGLPWASSLLADETFAESGTRLEQTAAAALSHLERVHGNDDVHLRTACQRVAERSVAQLQGPEQLPLPERIHHVSNELWPEKARALEDEDARCELSSEAAKVAQHHQLQHPGHVVLIAVVMFVLGSGVFADPQHLWARQALDASTDPDTRVFNLHKAACHRIAVLGNEHG